MKYTEKEKKALEFLINKRDEAYGLMQFEDGELYQLAEEEFNNYLTIEEIIDKQQKEIERLEILKQGYVPIEKYNELLNSKVGVDLSYDNYIHKEAIVNVLNKYAHEPIEETIVINFYKELQKLLGE